MILQKEKGILSLTFFWDPPAPGTAITGAQSLAYGTNPIFCAVFRHVDKASVSSYTDCNRLQVLT